MVNHQQWGRISPNCWFYHQTETCCFNFDSQNIEHVDSIVRIESFAAEIMWIETSLIAGSYIEDETFHDDDGDDDKWDSSNIKPSKKECSHWNSKIPESQMEIKFDRYEKL